jgi:hypothetical protein
MRLQRLAILPFLLLSVQVFSQQRTLDAVKLSLPPKIDGSLSDSVWSNLPEATSFIQNFPSFGLAATQNSIVKVGYDDNAIYIGAYLFDDPGLVRKQITARDAEQFTDVDYFSVFFDTYNDNQNGFQFLVTAANVQTDAKLGPNLGDGFGNFGDKTWDAVWESEVRMQPDGWIVELRIPYISLRFPKKEVQNWGFQVLRYIRRVNENNYWSPVNPEVNGFVNQFGDLRNLQNIQPPLRLSLSPYVSTGIRSEPRNTGNHTEWLRNGGMDIKYGLNESFTLDATLVPDFGQVISDNVVNNLTPYEIRFQENRPFFTEGTELFNKAGLFYSRRIGAIPSGYSVVNDLVDSDPDLEVLKNPGVVQLYNAIKFSGRTEKKTGIGVFNALTAPMHAIIRNKVTGVESRYETEPLANYNIIVLDQALKGRSYITLTNTNVIRNGNSRDANVSAVNFAFYDKKNIYALVGAARLSTIWDAEEYNGYSTNLRFGKVSGKWQFGIYGNIESDEYDPNDLGYLSSPNEVSAVASVSYNKFSPTKNFLTYNYTLETRINNLYKPSSFGRYDITARGFWLFKNFWDISLTTNINPVAEHNYFELQTPWKYIRYPLNYIFDMGGSTDSRKKLFIRFGGTFARLPDFDNNYYGLSLGGRYRFSNKFSLDLQTDSHREDNNVGFAFMREINGDPIAAYRDIKEFISVLSGIYNFTPRLNLTLRARHYWDKVDYLSYYNVDSKGELVPRAFIPGNDQNVNLFNLDAFLTWDFRLGSRLILGYKNWLGENESVVVSGKNTYLKNLGEIFSLRHGNEFTARFIYFLDVNQLKKKR